METTVMNVNGEHKKSLTDDTGITDDPSSISFDTPKSAILARRAMLVRLSISQWGAQIKDVKITRKTHDEFGIAREDETQAGSYQKKLFPKKVINAYKRATHFARDHWRSLTLPTEQDGVRILPAELYWRYVERMTELEEIWREKVEDFLKEYEDHKEEARKMLAGTYNESDYPPIDQVRQKFSFAWSISPLTSSDHLKLDGMIAEEEQRLREDIEDRLQQEFKMSVMDVWQRLYKSVRHAANRLEKYQVVIQGTGADKKATVKHPFRDSLITNLRDLLDILPALNITEDQKLTEMAQQVSDKIAIYEPSELRESTPLRKAIAEEAKEIAGEIGQHVQEELDLMGSFM